MQGTPLGNRYLPFRRGDANGDGGTSIADAIFTLGYLFAGGERPGCVQAGDANDDGAVDLSDVISVLRHLFGGMGSLPVPGDACGADPTADGTGCESYPGCGG